MFRSKDLYVHVVERYPAGLCQGIRRRASDIDGSLRDLTAKYHIQPKHTPPVSVPEPSVS